MWFCSLRFSLCSVPNLQMFSSSCTVSFPPTHVFISDFL